MKEKVILFVTGFLLYGSIGGLAMYYFESYSLEQTLKFGAFWGFLMALGEVFIFPKVKSYFSKNKK